MKRIVTKFGGSSLADAGQFRKVKEILGLDPARTYVVPSAPGRRFAGDEKVTDLLYRVFAQREAGEDWRETFDKVAARYLEIAEELGLTLDLPAALDEVCEAIAGGAGRDFCASRGEYLNGMLLANYLGWRFMDAAKVVYFDDRGLFESEKTNVVMMALISRGFFTIRGSAIRKPETSVQFS